ncbi:hypothetical protein CC85DRAFT_305489, partial [Cutaneotrichosporon oleaginosum]
MHDLTLVTDTSPATIDALAAAYVASFSLRTFYPAAAQFVGLDGERWHALQMRRVVAAALANPAHEVWCVLGDRAGGAGGAGGREVGAVVVLKMPGCP